MPLYTVNKNVDCFKENVEKEQSMAFLCLPVYRKTQLYFKAFILYIKLYIYYYLSYLVAYFTVLYCHGLAVFYQKIYRHFKV